MAIGISNFQTLYQTYYPDESLPYLVPEDLPVLNMVLEGSTDGQVSGDVIDMPWLIDAPSGTSQTFGDAQVQAGNAPSALRPQIRMSQLYQVMSFLDKDKNLSDGEASYGDLMEVTVRGARMNLLNNMDQLLHGNGSGNRVSFTWASATPTVLALNAVPVQLTGDTTGQALGSPVGQTMFTLNDQVVITSTNPKDGSAPTIVSGPYSISAISGNTNTVTLATAPAGLTNGNVYALAKRGDTLGFNPALVYPGVIGFDAANPFGGPAANDNYLNVNRSVYDVRGAGQWGDFSTGFNIEQAIRRMATQMKNSGVPSGGVTVTMYPQDYDALDGKLQTQARYGQHELGVFFFDSLVIGSTLGRLNIVPDVHQQQGFFRMYAPGFGQLMYKGGLPHFATLNSGLDEQWGSNYDGREKRLRAYFQMRYKDMRKMGIGKLPFIS